MHFVVSFGLHTENLIFSILATITYRIDLLYMVKLSRSCALIALSLVTLNIPAWADPQRQQGNDPIAHLLAQQTRSPSPETAQSETQIAYSSLNSNDAIGQLLVEQNNLPASNTRHASVSNADPIASLLDSEVLLVPEGKQQRIADAALNYLNIPYQWGGNSVATGFDCSGLVRALYQEVAGKTLPRSTAEQAAATTKINRTQLQPGDLVFFRTSRRSAYSHVGIYVGNDQFIHAPRTGAQIRIEDMSANYWQTRFSGARRVELR